MGDKVSPPGPGKPGTEIPCNCGHTQDGFVCACPHTIWVPDAWTGDCTRLVCAWCADDYHAVFR